MLLGYKSLWTLPMSGCKSALAQPLSCNNPMASASFAPGTETRNNNETQICKHRYDSSHESCVEYVTRYNEKTFPMQG